MDGEENFCDKKICIQEVMLDCEDKKRQIVERSHGRNN